MSAATAALTGFLIRTVVRKSLYQTEKMDILIAQRELIHRLYCWMLDEAEREAKSNYSLLRDINNVGVSNFLSITDTLDQTQRLSLAKALVKKQYFDAPKDVDVEGILQDTFLPEERQLALRYHEKSRTVQNRISRWQTGDCISTVPRKLIKVVTQHLSSVLQTKFIRDELSAWQSSTVMNDWGVITEIHFSGTGVECEQWIFRSDDSPKLVSADIYQQYLWQSMNFDYVRRLGVSSTRWVVECEQDIPSSLSSINLICTKFLAQLPILLQGLGIED